MTLEELGQKTKQKYPAYQSMTDLEVGQKVLAKYPVYQSQITSNQSSVGGNSTLKTIGKVLTAPYQAMGELNIGGARGVISTIKGIGSLGEKALQQTVGRIPGVGEALNLKTGTKTTAENLIPEKLTTPSNTLQSIGKTVEQVGEFFIPVGGETKALSLLKGIIPNAGRLTKLAAKVIGSGVEFGGKTAIQTGGDAKQTAISAGLGGVSPVVGAVGGVIKKAVTTKLPVRLNSIIFKTAAEDLAKEYKTIAKGQELNPILAQEALERGLKGNSENMGVYSYKKLIEIEDQVQSAVKGGNIQQTIKIDKKEGYLNVLKNVWNAFKVDFQTERSEMAKKLYNELKSSSGDIISTDLGLRLRRFIDKMRNTKSFQLDINLVPKQEGMKAATDSLRKKLSDAGLKYLMNEERFWIKAFDDIVADAAKRKNKNVLGLFDLLAGGGGMAAGGPLSGVSAALAVRGFQQPVTITNLAQALYKMRNIPSLQGLFKVIPPLLNNK
jgi:hypothetical protein